MTSSPPLQLLSVNTGRVQPLVIGGRKVLSAIGKQPAACPVPVGTMGLIGDEQADPTVHGGLDKALYMYPTEHLPWWREQRMQHGSSLFDEPLPHGFVGENLSIHGLLEHQVWIGDRLHFPDCSLRVTAPREPCFKFNAVMGLADAGRRMLAQRCCGWYLAVEQAGSLAAGQHFQLQAGPRGLRVDEAFAAKAAKHRR